MRDAHASFIFAIFTLLAGAGSVLSQETSKASVSVAAATPAYAEVLLRRTELQAELAAVSADYTPESTKISDLKYEIGALNDCIQRLIAVRVADADRLTVALGKLMVRHAALRAEVQQIERSHTPDHPNHRRAKQRLAVFDAAIKDLLP